MAGLFDDLVPRNVPTVPRGTPALTDEELALAQRPAVVTRSRTGAVTGLAPNTPEPASGGPTAAWFGPGSVADTTPESLATAVSGAFARFRQAGAMQQADEQAKTLEQINRPNPMGVRFPATTAARIARLAAENQRTGEKQALIGSGAEAQHEAVQPANMTTLQKIVRSSTDSILPIAAGLGFGGIAPEVGAIVAGLLGGAQQAGSTYPEALSKLTEQRDAAKIERDFLGRPTGRVLDSPPYIGGLPDAALRAKANNISGMDMASESLGDATPFHFFLKPGSTFLRRLVEGSLSDAGQEMVSQTMQAINKRANYDPNYTLHDALEDIAMAGGSGALMGAAGSTGGHAINAAREYDNKQQIAKTVADLLNQHIDATQFTPTGIDQAARAALSPPQPPNANYSIAQKTAQSEPISSPVETIQPNVETISPPSGPIAAADETQQLMQGADGEPPRTMTKQEMKAWDAQQPEPAELPDDPARYFKMDNASRVALSQIEPEKSDEEVKNSSVVAAKRMRGAYDGVFPTRDPITVAPLPNGKFKIVDGNSTYTAAKNYGWKSIPVQLDAAGVREHVGRQLQQAEQHFGDFRQFVHDAAHEAGGFPIVAKVKGIDRAVKKVLKDYKGDHTRLTDALRSTIVVNFPDDIAKSATPFFAKNKLRAPAKNLYAKKGNDSYAHLLSVVERNYGPAEVQFNTPEMIVAKERAHVLYEKQEAIYRDKGPNGFTKEQARQFAELDQRMELIYRAARQANAARQQRGERWTKNQIAHYIENGRASAKQLAAQDLSRLDASATRALKRSSSMRSSEPGFGTRPKLLPPGTSNASMSPPSTASTLTGTPSQSQNERITEDNTPDGNQTDHAGQQPGNSNQGAAALGKADETAQGPTADAAQTDAGRAGDEGRTKPVETQDADAFHQAITKAKAATPYGAAVYAYDVGDYRNMRLFLSPSRLTGYALKGDDIVSVFNADPSFKNAAKPLLAQAVANGGRRLDAFDTVLPYIYGLNGFRAVARVKWDDSQAPSDWNKSTFAAFNDGRPDVVFMVYDPAYGKEYQPGDGKLFENYDNAVRRQQLGVDEANVEEHQQQMSGSASTAIRASTSTFVKHLTPDEQRRVTRLLSAKIVQHLSTFPSANEMAAIAHAGRAKRGWYAKSAEAIKAVFGADGPRFATLLAAMSPQTPVESNLRNTLNTWKNWIKAGRPTDRKAIVQVMADSVDGNGHIDSVLPAWINNSVRALTSENPSGEQISGPKVNSFFKNLIGDVNEVTLDAWMANYAAVDQRIFAGTLNKKSGLGEKNSGNLAMAARVREAAARLTELSGEKWTPAEVQETIWSWAKALYEHAEANSMAPSEVLKSGQLTDELINSTVDFGGLFQEPEYAQILKDAGYESETSGRSGAGGNNAAFTDQVTGAKSKAGPFAEKTQQFHERAAARRLDQLKEQRADERGVMSGDAGTAAQASEQQSNQGGAFERLGLKTANPERLGFRARIEVNTMSKLEGANLNKVSQAIAGIVSVGGMPEAYLKDVAAYVQFSPVLSGFKAAYWPASQVIGINTDVLKNYSVPMIGSYIAHEVAHHLDNGTGKPVTTDALNYISSSSQRTQLTLKPADEMGVIDIDSENTGDLIHEILDLTDTDTAAFFDYPLVGLLDGKMNAQTGSAEFFAQVSALYTVNPDKVKTLLPKWAKVMRQIYGDKASGVAAPATIGQARARLRQALQNDSAIVEDDGHIGRPNDAQTDDQSNRPSDRGGQARVRVGGRNNENQKPPGGQPPGSGPSGPANAPSQPSGQWGINEPGLIDNFIREFQNNKIDLKRVTDAIEKVAGTLPIDENPVLAEELFKGRVRAKINRFERELVKPLLRDMAAANVTPDELGKYLWAVHAPERNAQMAKVNPGTPLDNNLSGLSNDEAKQIIADIKKSGKLADMKRLAEMIYGINKATQLVLVSQGLEDQSTIDAWNNTYKHYVPLFRDSDEAQAGAGFTVKGPESKRAMGSQKEAIAIAAAVIAQHERALIRAEKADVGRTLLHLAETHPAPNFWKVDTPPTKRVINKTTGLVENIIDPLYKNRDDTFIVKELVGGKVRERVLAFNPKNDRALALSKAMRNLDAVQLGAFTKIAGNVTRMMANLATSWNPQFWATNFARDVQTAAVNLQATPLKGHAPQVMANIVPAMKGVLSAEFRDGTGKWSDLYRRFEDAGGKMGFMDIFDDLIDRQRAIAKEIERSQRSNINPLKWANIAIDSIEKVNAAVENATRLAVFGEAIKMGLPDKQAASIAKNITVNFDRKGNRSAAIGAWYMFFNANIQGTAVLMKAIGSSKKVAGFVGVMTAFAAAMELINRMIGDADRDEDGNNPYELVPDYVKQNSMVFMLPKMDRTSQNKGVATIPLPYGFSIFHNAGRLAMEAILRNSKFVDEKRTAGDLAMDFMGALANNFAPFGGTSTPLQYFAPTIVKPVVQQLENKTWYGAPIHPEPQQFGKAKSNSEQYFRSTSDTAKDLSRFLNNISGGDDIHGGALDIYPGNIEHVFSTIAGGTGRFGLGMFDFTKHMINRATGEDKPEDMPWRNVPFVGKFYGEVDERDRAAKYYRLSKDAMQTFKEYTTYKKSGDRDKADAIEEAHPELIEMARVIVSKRHKADMKAIRGEFEAVDELPRDQRAKAKAGLRKDETDIMGEALRVYNDVLKERREGR